MSNFEDVPIDFIKQVLSENTKLYICQLYKMFQDYNSLTAELNDNKIFIILADRYNLSVSGVKLIFWRKFNEHIRTTPQIYRNDL